jgi:hypothetical protein
VRALPGKRFRLDRHNPSLPLTAQSFQRSATEYLYFHRIKNQLVLFTAKIFISCSRAVVKTIYFILRCPMIFRNIYCNPLLIVY